jgi:hypothetical protein
MDLGRLDFDCNIIKSALRGGQGLAEVDSLGDRLKWP